MPQWTITKLDNARDEYVGKFAGTSDMQKWMRLMPNPMPSTHELTYEYDVKNYTIRIRTQARGLAVEADSDVQKMLSAMKRPDLETWAAQHLNGFQVPKKFGDQQAVAFVLDELARREKK